MNQSSIDQEQQRRVLEARARLREGFITRDRVDDPVKRVTIKRGERAAEQLRQDMREQWKTRHQWMAESTVQTG